MTWTWESCALGTCYDVVYADSLTAVSAPGFSYVESGAAETMIESAGRIADLIKERLGVGHAETTEDLKFTAEYVACIGACGMAPVIMVNEGTYGSLTVQKTDEVIEKYKQMD